MVQSGCAFSRARPFALIGCAALVAGAVIAVPSAASAAVLSCGATVRTSVVLTANLDCSSDSSSSALNIGAAGVAVNLNGYKIVGPGSAVSTEGIADAGYNHVAIGNGTISGFSTAVDLEGVSSNALLNGADLTALTVTNSDTGVNTNYVSRIKVSRSSFDTNSVAVNFNFDISGVATYNRVTTPGTAFIDTNGTSDTLANNVIALVNGQGCTGFYIEGTTSELIQRNSVDGRMGCSGTGISDMFSGGQITTGNTLNYLATGIYESDIDGVVSANYGIHDYYGIYEGGAIGIRYLDNHFNWGDYGIYVYDPGGTFLSGNVTNHNANAGVYIFVDSVYCGPCTAKLINNTAEHNGLGLYSQVPTTGYGNFAEFNPIIDCHNVVCVPPPPSSGSNLSLGQVANPSRARSPAQSHN